jgi:hypothetical protein
MNDAATLTTSGTPELQRQGQVANGGRMAGAGTYEGVAEKASQYAVTAQ